MDGFGSTRWVTDAAGTITDSIDYDAFGVEIGRSGSTEVEHLYRGEAYDPNVGFYYLRARWMDPSVGRFSTVDPWKGCQACPISLNKYLYAHSDPISGRDPSGLMNLTELSAAQRIQTSLNFMVRRQLKGAIQSRTLGAFRNNLGKIVERHVKRLVEECLKGKPYKIRPGRGLGPDVKNLIDFFIEVGDAILDLEVKYQYKPTTSAPFKRMATQLELAARKFGKVSVFFSKAPGPIQRKRVVDAMSGKGGEVAVIGGFVELAQNLSSTFNVDCF